MDLPFPKALDPDPGWSALKIPARKKRSRSFVSGDPDGPRLRVRYYQRDADGGLVGKAWFGPEAEGPPGCAHGGAMASVLDEAMGAAAWIAGHIVLAARLTTDFRRPLPLGTVARFEAVVAEANGRKVITKGRLIGPDGAPYCEAEGLFIQVDPAALGPEVQRALGDKDRRW